MQDFADKVLTPGFVQSHAHALEGGVMDDYPYVGSEDRWDPDGNRWGGLKTLDDVVNALKRAEAEMPEMYNAAILMRI